ncbi:RNA polymerase sigma factor FliA [Aquisalimonas lutea]|uniref:RNA polymerase sigma factor FliA n=1 Tax=Aquisalimonas lutea TaxID=1327750 RepID=UPI0025B4E868|nr:RNA polymerase sigma factor FliA [Aquisalimonas lutea]MDN3518297.1 RNA polymerase sigma factor FliA [Aquisalimonas lutea]
MKPRAALYSEIQAQNSENDLLVQHAPLVKRIAHHMLARLPDSVQLEDLIQSGMIGLLEAARQFDSSQGASFTTYAGIRIRGAMLDEIRRLDWTPRSVHRRGREVAQAAREIENRTGRDARDSEIMEALGMTADDYYQVLHDVSTARLFSLDEASPSTGEAREPESDDDGPARRLEDAGFRQALAEAIAGLPEREQLVMSLYYEQELNLREIGEVLGVTESRISQIHGRIMLKLKDRLADWTG